jgi:hypothetical protein
LPKRSPKWIAGIVAERLGSASVRIVWTVAGPGREAAPASGAVEVAFGSVRRGACNAGGRDEPTACEFDAVVRALRAVAAGGGGVD